MFEPIYHYGAESSYYSAKTRDPYPAPLMRRRAPRLHRWTERMNSREFPPPEFPEAEDAFLRDDAIPETTTAALELVAQDFFPEVSALLSGYNEWQQARQHNGCRYFM